MPAPAIPVYIGPQATAEYNAISSGNATSVPAENGGGPGTHNAHWRKSAFTNELMTGYVGPGRNLPLSRVTIASLADLGYQVNMGAAAIRFASPRFSAEIRAPRYRGADARPLAKGKLGFLQESARASLRIFRWDGREITWESVCLNAFRGMHVVAEYAHR